MPCLVRRGAPQRRLLHPLLRNHCCWNRPASRPPFLNWKCTACATGRAGWGLLAGLASGASSSHASAEGIRSNASALLPACLHPCAQIQLISRRPRMGRRSSPPAPWLMSSSPLAPSPPPAPPPAQPPPRPAPPPSSPPTPTTMPPLHPAPQHPSLQLPLPRPLLPPHRPQPPRAAPQLCG